MIRRWRWALLVVVAVALGVGAAIVRDAVQVEQTSTTAESLAAPLATLCSQDEDAARAAGADCPRAAQIAREGVDGRNGVDGRGVLGTSLQDGNLVVAYSDGTSTTVGRVAGADGLTVVGPPGRGIAGTTIEGGRLIVTFTDGTRADQGAVVGPAGVGIASVSAVEGRLLVTFTDGRTEDVGPLPVGPAGKDGENGENGRNGADAPPLQRTTFSFPDGSTRVCERSGGPEDAPVMRCGDRVPPAGADPAPTPTEGG